MIIETPRLLLRDFRPGDADDYVAITRHAKYRRFYSEQEMSQQHARCLVDMFVAQAAARPRTKFQLAITMRNERSLIGTCGIRLEGEGQASAGCGLASGRQAQGIAEEAMRAMLDFAFAELEVHRVYAETISENKAALRLLRRIGLRIEGELVENRYFQQRWWNTVIAAIRRDEWLANKAEGKEE